MWHYAFNAGNGTVMVSGAAPTWDAVDAAVVECLKSLDETLHYAVSINFWYTPLEGESRR